jgi:hypothetical protein
MAGREQKYGSRSLAIYALLLRLYPRKLLQQHRAEMLQNFTDIEQAASSTAALWLLMGKDLAMSLISTYAKSRMARYVIGVLIAWALVFAIGFWRCGGACAPQPGHPALDVFGGFLLGMLSMYIATRVYRSGPDGTQP